MFCWGVVCFLCVSLRPGPALVTWLIWSPVFSYWDNPAVISIHTLAICNYTTFMQACQYFLLRLFYAREITHSSIFYAANNPCSAQRKAYAISSPSIGFQTCSASIHLLCKRSNNFFWSSAVSRLRSTIDSG